MCGRGGQLPLLWSHTRRQCCVRKGVRDPMPECSVFMCSCVKCDVFVRMDAHVKMREMRACDEK